MGRQAARHETGLRSQRGKVRAVLRVGEVAYVRLERIGRGIGIEGHQGGVVQSILQEVGEIVDLLFGKTQTVRVSRPTRVREAGRQRGLRSGGGVHGNTGVGVLHYIADVGEDGIVEEVSAVLHLTQGQDAEPEGISRVMGDSLPPSVLAVVRETVRTPPDGAYMPSPPPLTPSH